MFNRTISGFLVAFVLLVGTVPVVSSALTANEVQEQIQSLLVQVQELTRQLNELLTRFTKTPPPVVTATSTPSMPPTQHRVCDTVYRTLTVGGQGDDVKSLQEFLHDEGYLEADATGYFGAMTREAVAKWQTSQDIVIQSSTGTSGEGTFGPKSRDYIKRWCGGDRPSGERFNATPTRGEAPLAVTFSTWLSGFRVPNISYTIEFGDSTSEQAASCYAPADACQEPGHNTHTYTANGSYTATLTKITDPCGGNTMCKAAIHQEVIAKQQIQVGPIACTKEYRPVCGAQPIVCITTPCNPVPTTYGNKCAMEAAKASFLYEGACRNTTTDPASDPQCKSWYDGCNTCSRSEPGGPTMCTLRACMQESMSAPYCTSYFGNTSKNKAPTISGLSGPTVLKRSETGTWSLKATDPENDPLSYSITWGDEQIFDSTYKNVSGMAPAFTQSTTFTHTYGADGTYTVAVTVRDSTGNEARVSATVRVSTEQPVACTMQYDPVCGRPQGCVDTCAPGMYCTAMCRMPDPVTYSNKCFLKAANADFISEGACPTN